jgi:hypothetical protein
MRREYCWGRQAHSGQNQAGEEGQDEAHGAALSSSICFQPHILLRKEIPDDPVIPGSQGRHPCKDRQVKKLLRAHVAKHGLKARATLDLVRFMVRFASRRIYLWRKHSPSQVLASGPRPTGETPIWRPCKAQRGTRPAMKTKKFSSKEPNFTIHNPVELY